MQRLLGLPMLFRTIYKGFNGVTPANAKQCSRNGVASVILLRPSCTYRSRFFSFSSCYTVHIVVSPSATLATAALELIRGVLISLGARRGGFRSMCISIACVIHKAIGTVTLLVDDLNSRLMFGARNVPQRPLKISLSLTAGAHVLSPQRYAQCQDPLSYAGRPSA